MVPDSTVRSQHMPAATSRRHDAAATGRPTTQMRVVQDGPRMTLHLSGDCDLVPAPAIAAAAIAWQSCRDVVVDLHAATFLACAGVGALARLQTILEQCGGDFRLVQAPPPVTKVLASTGMLPSVEGAGRALLVLACRDELRSVGAQDPLAAARRPGVGVPQHDVKTSGVPQLLRQQVRDDPVGQRHQRPARDLAEPVPPVPQQRAHATSLPPPDMRKGGGPATGGCPEPPPMRRLGQVEPALHVPDLRRRIGRGLAEQATSARRRLLRDELRTASPPCTRHRSRLWPVTQGVAGLGPEPRLREVAACVAAEGLTKPEPLALGLSLG